ncbi:50S ribosomal protein L24 [Candidatus Uhrbacteria bacterium]|nr:50S ribosomal protein L24 [Candidatus Uhrbacteria bacterium]
MKIKTGDTVKITHGKDRGKTGKITQVFPQALRVVVEGLNLRKRHLRPTRRGERGQLVEFAAPLVASNVRVICSKCGAPTRLGTKIVEEPTGRTKKLRVCKKCKQTID